MERAQQQEYGEVEQQQKNQFIEFSRAWDKYMTDYEMAATSSVARLKEKHVMELQQLKIDL